MAKKNPNTFNEDLDIIINDPFAEDEKSKAEEKPKEAKKELVEEKPASKSENASGSAKKSRKKKSDNYSFDTLVKTINELEESGALKEKFSTVQIPAKYLQLIRDISIKTGKTSSSIATSIVRLMFLEMQDDIKEMLEEKERERKNMFDL
ncbi:hypothetical protein [Flexithrix dorotheae]|uniref:hypothetical protein n=1 Tax=Flexithrix dorotheae TaxID=70993 RepID=UPI00036E919C|nr:hypothetical protein [Flexithrix dorotheae]